MHFHISRPFIGQSQNFGILLFMCLIFYSAFAFAAKPGFSDCKVGEPVMAASDSLTETEKAASAISGTSWPGVIDHLLQKPQQAEEAGQSFIHINYPSTGDRRVDSDIREWVASIAAAFEEYLEPNAPSAAKGIDLEIDSFLHDDDLNVLTGHEASFELWGDYRIDRPSGHALSVTFELWNYLSPGEGNLDILTLNYSMFTGQRLSLADIFEKPELALELMSNWSRRQLAARLGTAKRAQMLQDGTEPLVENFSSITLIPDGICINFQPFQVAPGSAGVQKVEMPLHELLAAEPLLALWDK